jgi:solute carrier family 25 (mitochondrial carrier), member 14/30
MVIAREEGILALWKGMVPSAVREMSYSSIRFGLYAPIKKFLIGETSPAEVPLWKKIVAGGLAGGVGSAIANPTDLLKIRMQADANVVPKRMLAHCSDIYRHGGVKGFWMGTSTTVARAVVLGATKLATYDEAKLLGKKYFGLQGLPLQTVAGAMAGFAYVCTSAPVDFTRTRLMTARQMAQQTGGTLSLSLSLSLALALALALLLSLARACSSSSRSSSSLSPPLHPPHLCREVVS